MRLIFFKIAVLSLLLPVCISGGSPASFAAEGAAPEAFSHSGLPLPRFVSLGKRETNVRAGPGQKYPVKWVVHRKSLPVEVMLEFENWRKIRDHEGQEGWVYHTLLSGRRTALIRGEASAPVRGRTCVDDGKSRILAYFEPMVQVSVKSCEGECCYVSTDSFSGWMKRKFLWGVYENEKFD